ncbi:DUF3579 domain-containing protein [Rhodocyclus tenuis]|uniref:DUF3579 domain-containing protein n=2 Tax=Rhodocyclus TaxID=1064 RepID=A0A6L5JSW4_RHOTE|nr:DUF3579 domain-containing protein [Rhodocyclus gracilis]MQY50517.1 DUF3579 domain-containing protein [Rhodocyclus gracilis]MRD72511.1 DUF3579 domain-containing protein [Rhodocyclus gracilis]NJA88021.1 DUF3579 domain-containing protein [Rhodocyclus gracilis]
MSEELIGISFVIVGQTLAGKRFRPSDWAERLCGVLSGFGAGKRVQYSPYVGPGDYEGHKAVFVDGRLYDFEPMAYRFVLHFARDNELRVLSNVSADQADKPPSADSAR